jgi:hypothetical protein
MGSAHDDDLYYAQRAREREFEVRVWDVLKEVTFPDFKYVLKHNNGGYYLQIECQGAADNVTTEPTSWKGRKWLLSMHMTDSEVVTTAFKATLTAIEHETREQFKYMGQSIFDPHYDVRQLVALRSAAGCLDTRPDGMQG